MRRIERSWMTAATHAVRTVAATQIAATIATSPSPASPVAYSVVLATGDVGGIAAGLAIRANGGFWPVWMLLGTGLAVLGTLVRAGFGLPEHDRGARRQERRERRDDR